MFANELGKLTDKLINAASRHDADGKRINSKVLVVRPVITQLKYNDGNISHTKSIEYIEKDEWHIIDQFEFIQNTVKEFEEYKQCVKSIVEQFNVTDKEADSKLTRYVQVVITRYFDDQDNFSVLDAVSSFIQDIDDTPIIWQVQGALQGLILAEEEIDIGRYKLRRPKPSDFEIEERFDTIALGTPLRDFDMLGRMPTAFLEYKTRAVTHNEVYVEYNRILDLLRLYKLGSILSVSFRPKPISIIRMAGWQSPTGRHGIPYKYKVTADETEAVDKFINDNETHLVRISNEDGRDDRCPLLVSLTRYRDALSTIGALESRVTSAITCLESLLLKAQERSELSHRLCQRASYILNHFAFNPIKTYEMLQRAYDVRSTYIHGSELEEDRRKDLNELAQESIEYARIIFCVFLQLSVKYAKDSLIKKIDNAILDNEAKENLTQIIMESVKVELTKQ